MLKKSLCAILLAYCVGVHAQSTVNNAPTLPQKSIGEPKVLQKSILNREELYKTFREGSDWGTGKTEKKYWTVHSDRENNWTYTECVESASKRCTKLGFNQEVRIALVKGDWALVYKEEAAVTPDWPVISKGKSLGWIPMNHLLLWNTCPADNRGVYYKGIISINLNVLDYDEKPDPKRYLHPTEKSGDSDLTMDMQYYFIMKEEEGMGLLCTSPTLDKQSLFGWVKKSIYADWTQRTCMEPNWEPSFVDTHKGSEAAVFKSELLNSGDKFVRWTFGETNGSSALKEKYRMVPEQLRFPILGRITDNSKSVKCTVFSDESGDINNTGGIINDASGNWKEKLEGLSHLNLIIVIESTSEMKKYFPAVKAAVDELQSIAKQDWTIRVGVVTYKGMQSGANKTDYVSLSKADNQNLQSILSGESANGSTSGANSNVAIAEALNIATDKSKMKFEKYHSNLLLIIGNRGPAEGDMGLEDENLKQRLVDCNMNTMSIQVMRKKEGTQDRFNNQVYDLIKNFIDNKYEKIGHGKADWDWVSSERNGYSFKSMKGNNFFFARYLWNSKWDDKEHWTALNSETLTQYICSGLKGFSKIITKQIAEFNKASRGMSYDRGFLSDRLGGPEELENWQKMHAIFAYDGYALLHDNSGGECWKYILFVDDRELDMLLTELEPVKKEAAKGNFNNRKIFINAMRSLVKKFLGADNKTSIDDMSAEELNETIYGLNVRSDVMKRYSLKYIRDKMTEKEYREMVNNFVSHYDELVTIRNSNYKYKLSLNKSTYYWIPIDIVP